MSGIYIHIPFCKTRCHYCDFYTSTSFKDKSKFVEALKAEVLLTQKYLSDKEIKTIYFGGGTPSVLSITEISDILNSIYANHKVDPQCEITLEANPDDISKSNCEAYQSIGINRISLGIQSFNDDMLRFMNRRHNAQRGIASIIDIYSSGITNISIDFIYGIPGLTEDMLKETLLKVKNLPVSHVSAYHLTIEEGTVFGNWKSESKLREIREDDSFSQFLLVTNYLENLGFEQYEISNFAKEGKYSKHNSSYWSFEPYLGLGPSAHSFNVVSRQWNIANTDKYIQGLLGGNPKFSIEYLGGKDKFNEFIMLSLRTKKGINWIDFSKLFDSNYKSYLIEKLEKFQDYLIINGVTTSLTKEGLFISDKIISDCLITEVF